MEKIEKIVQKVCNNYKISLYDIYWKHERKGKVLVIKITKPGNISITDCKLVSKELSSEFDKADLIKSKYYLEVSSPGLVRELKSKKHYISALKQKIKIEYMENKSKKSEIGILKEVKDNFIIMEYNKGEKEIKFANINKAKTILDLN